ncbi:hypothetical protein [Marixanthomonas spongiae]|uniref:Uncharacterized protein n=1 Tax=Marixanthomonas spongiae TaxID=2174845 RepID=A0A2U0I1Q8_9FLAO|nr:hypothetical protein [Marixanthomonas spongiae]PVW15051.1 hypothetical protein DDV96_06470 [Marixanthomonas spongiae]
MNDQNRLKALLWSRQLVDLGGSSEQKSSSYKQLKAELAAHLDRLVATDFNKLVAILYRIDISEEKAKTALAAKDAHETAGEILAQLIVERQVQKIQFRQSYGQH